MRYMATYDMMETVRNTNQWLGASALSLASYPIFSMVPNPALQWMAAWGEVTERTFARMVVKPSWGIRTFTCKDGKDHLVNIETVVEQAQPAQGSAGGTDVGPLCNPAALDREIASGQLRGLHHRLAQRP